MNNTELNECLWESARLTSKFLEKLPIKKISGNALCYDQRKEDNVLNNFHINKKCSPLVTLIADAEITRNSSKGNVIRNRSENVCELYMNFLVKGDSSTHHTQFDGLKKLSVDKGIIKDFGVEGFNSLWLKDKYDFILMTKELFYQYRWTTLNPTNFGDLKEPFIYLGIPIYFTDWIEDEFIPENIWQKCRQWLSTKVKWIKPCKANYSTVYLGKFDDGSMTKGISGIYGSENILNVQSVGTHPSKDADIYRIKGYLGLAVFNEDDIVKVRIKL